MIGLIWLNGTEWWLDVGLRRSQKFGEQKQRNVHTEVAWKEKKTIWNLPHEYHFLQLETTECCSWLPHNASDHKLTARHKSPIWTESSWSNHTWLYSSARKTCRYEGMHHNPAFPKLPDWQTTLAIKITNL